ncbi:hypothetical protein AVEN_261807-1 [Araneus ventricosus]|uniref:Deoxynucleoside kinase domain-containing protein n=1 Tax=Araneus ventricosus TaxID=182803 RepID=A0A4Y2LY87_ARAVE|nr:hypothetical protein AVEN_261807-1 [Araneus ventricosus]
MVRLLVEVQASHVGIGKSTFVEKLGYPWIDDCVNLVESDPPFFYGPREDIFQNDADNDLLRAYLVLENFAASLDKLSGELSNDWTIVASRSPVISSVQFANHVNDWKPLAKFYRKRLDHLKVNRVLVLDYGSSIQANKTFLENAFRRMKQRGRQFELNAFNTFETYCQFFEAAESKKIEIVETYLKEPEFFKYEAMTFHDFDETDIQYANKLIWDFREMFAGK